MRKVITKLFTAVMIVAFGYFILSSIVKNWWATTMDYSEVSIWKLVDARNDYAKYTAKPLVRELVGAILYIREIDQDLKEYGITVNDNSWLFVEIDGVKYKIGLER